MILDSLKALIHSVALILITRLEILSLDIEEKTIRFVGILMLMVFTLLFLSLGIIFGVFWVVVLFWETHRLIAIGLSATLLFFIGIILLAVLIYKIKNCKGVFDTTLHELNKDLKKLSGSKD